MLTATDVFELLYTGAEPGSTRFTQDSPILPDVWVAFATDVSNRLGLLLTPHNDVTTGQLAKELRTFFFKEVPVVACESHVLVTLDIWQTVSLMQFTRLTESRNVEQDLVAYETAVAPLHDLFQPSMPVMVEMVMVALQTLGRSRDGKRTTNEAVIQIARMLLVAATIDLLRSRNNESVSWEKLIARFLEQFPNDGNPTYLVPLHVKPMLWSVSFNRPAHLSIVRSRQTVKADAATSVFIGSAETIRWAVLDSGIDARHPAFARTKKGHRYSRSDELIDPLQSRVVRTFDVRRLRRIIEGRLTDTDKQQLALAKQIGPEELEEFVSTVNRDLIDGRMIDWETWAPLLSISHAQYLPPDSDHGTHVAGILGANWRAADYESAPPNLADGDLLGISPEIELFDFRVFDGGASDEFTLLAALQFIRWLNQNVNKRLLHGANLSFSLRHDVRNYACGRTPICQECERLWGSGVIVVASAGNFGFHDPLSTYALGDAYRSVTITDPGNTERIITVGSTHRDMPHAYGVSYFSSKGPTGDGRYKPDLLAPGEKIHSTARNGGSLVQEGTSMAAPHVSGAAALILARHPEFIGNPDKIKKVLCETATDLGRNRYFQGAGLVDVFRALQSL